MNRTGIFYGSFIEKDLSFERRRIYDILVEYFDNPRMVKWKDNDNFSIYISKIKTFLSKDSRYLICIIKKDNENPGSEFLLSELYWDSFQTRTLNLPLSLPFHSYEIKRGNSPSISVISRSKTNVDYSCPDLPIKVTLLPTKGEYEYSDKGNLYSALETYQTIITHLS